MKTNRLIALGCFGLMGVTGCIVVPARPEPSPVVVGPVVSGPGVEVIDVEPAPVDRVYIYDPGYPPGCYFYNNYYWYNGYRYPHDVFVREYVTVNVRERRFVDVNENRRSAVIIQDRHRTEYAANHGVHGRPAVRPAGRPGPEHRE